jgi:hypothetical protein
MNDTRRVLVVHFALTEETSLAATRIGLSVAAAGDFLTLINKVSAAVIAEETSEVLDVLGLQPEDRLRAKEYLRKAVNMRKVSSAAQVESVEHGSLHVVVTFLEEHVVDAAVFVIQGVLHHAIGEVLERSRLSEYVGELRATLRNRIFSRARQEVENAAASHKTGSMIEVVAVGGPSDTQGNTTTVDVTVLRRRTRDDEEWAEVQAVTRDLLRF